MSLSAFFKETVYSKTKSLETRWLEYSGGERTLKDVWDWTTEDTHLEITQKALLDSRVEIIAFIFKNSYYFEDTHGLKRTWKDLIHSGNTKVIRILLALGMEISVEYRTTKIRGPKLLFYNKIFDAVSYALRHDKADIVYLILFHRQHDFQPYAFTRQVKNAIRFQSYIFEVKRNTITLLALKRRRIRSMGHLDRFLMHELSLQIWSERLNLI